MLWFSDVPAIKKDYNNFENQRQQQIHICIRIYIYVCISILFITFPLNSFSLRTNENRRNPKGFQYENQGCFSNVLKDYK